MCSVDFSSFENTDKASKNHNNQIEKYMFINVSNASLVNKHEDEFECLSKVAKNVLHVPITNVNNER